jgi:integrase
MGGLHPCEIVSLRWSDVGIGMNKDRFRVYNTRVERFENLYEREVPLFPEVSEELEKLRSQVGEEVEFVIGMVGSSSWLRTVSKIAERAGIGTIPRAFDNMRASRSTEVYDQYGAAKESAWIGHSHKIAKEFYLMVTEDDFAEAAGKKSMLSVEQE